MSENIDLKMKENDLIQLFAEYGVDIDLYGVGEAKSISSLAQEVLDGETEIIETDGKLEKRIGAVAIKLLFIDSENNTLKLFEEKQIFRDGRVRIREPLYETSIVEKIHPGEDKKIAMARGVFEEIGINIYNLIINEPESHSRLRDSKSYPGIQTNQETFVFPDVVISDENFKPDGYVEKQKEKTTYFVWRKEE